MPLLVLLVARRRVRGCANPMEIDGQHTTYLLLVHDTLAKAANPRCSKGLGDFDAQNMLSPCAYANLMQDTSLFIALGGQRRP